MTDVEFVFDPSCEVTPDERAWALWDAIVTVVGEPMTRGSVA